jgi:hypothetical protein
VPSLSEVAMTSYVQSSLSRTMQKELPPKIALRKRIIELGLPDRVAPGGWLVRTVGENVFGHTTAVVFPEIVLPGVDYAVGRLLPRPTLGLHTICSTFHQSGIASFYCAATVGDDDDPSSLGWHAIELGLPAEQPYTPFLDAAAALNFRRRERAYNFLRYKTETAGIPEIAMPEEFSKEHLRVTFQTGFFSEISDIDGIFWGQQHTYPLEIKEKTPAPSKDLGPYFGLDVGPFVKLAFYAAKRGNLHSIFVVREIDSTETRNLVNWWFVTFDHMAQFASWVQQGGGRTMTGGRSSVVRIPKAEFQELNAASLAAL